MLISSDFRNRYGKYILFATLFLLLLLKIYLFHWTVFQSVPLSSLWSYPQQFFSFHLPKIAIALFFAAFALIDRHWITVALSFLLDIWIIANLVYFRAYDSVLDIFAFSMAGNMKGWWGSVFFFMSIKDAVYLVLSCVYVAVYKVFSGGGQRAWVLTLAFTFSAYLINLVGVECHRYCYTHNYDEKIVGITPHYFNPFSYAMRNTIFTNHAAGTVSYFSIFHQIGFVLNDTFRIGNSYYKFTPEDETALASMNILNPQSTRPLLEHPVIIVLWESLEDWVVNPVATPNLWRFMQNHHHLHATRLARQVKGGNSMDGQMILNTGLLPISEGAVAFTFPHNTFPSLADCSQGPDAVIVPHEAIVWNQNLMSKALGYDTTISVLPPEEYLFGEVIELRNNGYVVVQAVTAASHAPFSFGATRSSLQFIDAEMPHYMQAYMQACHYTDEHLAPLLEAFDCNPAFSEASLILTGDHTIFSQELRRNFQRYSDETGLGLHCNQPFCPLIVYTPSMQQTVLIDDVDACQMDAFSTYMPLLGLQDYYWKGLGVNLLDSVRFHRRYSEQEAYEMSDHLIRSNYFKQY
ncbi:MAG: sulfatase-like hydrolase/transferase [Paludibacteraceae bacterium]|nr:sulfatase-like hydrolase/transferase [Paludibacteraceae bacterium]